MPPTDPAPPFQFCNYFAGYFISLRKCRGDKSMQPHLQMSATPEPKLEITMDASLHSALAGMAGGLLEILTTQATPFNIQGCYRHSTKRKTGSACTAPLNERFEFMVVPPTMLILDVPEYMQADRDNLWHFPPTLSKKWAGNAALDDGETSCTYEIVARLYFCPQKGHFNMRCINWSDEQVYFYDDMD